ncbi:hypothetical protein VF724_09140 [Paenibacillaceae bacterium T2]|uniref:Uncharacterized protein n=1 Tax=Ferviditalea candida TaxID=3108399 RepID=A0ABU5ZH37_9BACL|nr:hypothetical protein [Paenibacillaceae bacterium T2]
MANTGIDRDGRTSLSRMAPSMTKPAAPFLMQLLTMISPTGACIVPPAFTTRTSTGSSISIAFWITRLSPGGKCTVTACPAIAGLG